MHIAQLKAIDHRYVEADGLFTVTFATSHICAASDPGQPQEPPPESPPIPQPPKKGWGFFSTLFLLAFIGFVAYFVIGAYVQRTQYGATGWDLIVRSCLTCQMAADCFVSRIGISGRNCLSSFETWFPIALEQAITRCNSMLHCH